MSDFLKGPWTIDPSSNPKGVAENLILDKDGNWMILIINNQQGSFEECEKVTRVVAACPEMLEVLELATQTVAYDNRDLVLREKAQAILKKVKGEK